MLGLLVSKSSEVACDTRQRRIGCTLGSFWDDLSIALAHCYSLTLGYQQFFRGSFGKPCAGSRICCFYGAGGSVLLFSRSLHLLSIWNMNLIAYCLIALVRQMQTSLAVDYSGE